MIGTAVPSITQLCSVPDSKGSTRERKLLKEKNPFQKSCTNFCWHVIGQKPLTQPPVEILVEAGILVQRKKEGIASDGQ